MVHKTTAAQLGQGRRLNHYVHPVQSQRCAGKAENTWKRALQFSYICSLAVCSVELDVRSKSLDVAVICGLVLAGLQMLLLMNYVASSRPGLEKPRLFCKKFLGFNVRRPDTKLGLIRQLLDNTWI